MLGSCVPFGRLGLSQPPNDPAFDNKKNCGSNMILFRNNYKGRVMYTIRKRRANCHGSMYWRWHSELHSRRKENNCAMTCIATINTPYRV